MNAKGLIQQTLDMSDMIVGSYVNDLEDADLKVRPMDGMNPIAWQLGHVLSFERMMVEGIKPGSSPPLPEGFDAAHSTDAARANNFAGLKTKAEYLGLMQSQRAATKAMLDGLADVDLEAPAPEQFRKFTPTVGGGLSMVGLHTMMHVGQFVPVRRKLQKPVVI